MHVLEEESVPFQEHCPLPWLDREWLTQQIDRNDMDGFRWFRSDYAPFTKEARLFLQFWSPMTGWQ